MTKPQLDATSPKSFSFPILNLIVFIMAIFIIASWVNYHLDLPWVAMLFGFVNVLVAIIGVIKGLFTDDDESMIKRFLRKLLMTCLHPVSLIILVFAVLFVCNFFSSIRIYKGGISEKLEASLVSERDGKVIGFYLEKPNSIESILRFTNPFGRSYRLEVDGYRGYSFELYPWVGKRIKIENDLKTKPSLFLRFLPFPADLEDGTLKLVVETDTIASFTFDSTLNGSIMLGRRKAIPGQWEGNWNNELILKDARYDETLRKLLIAGWMKYKHEKLDFPLAENTLMKAFFFNHANNLIAKNEFLITGESLQDYLLE